MKVGAGRTAETNYLRQASYSMSEVFIPLAEENWPEAATVCREVFDVARGAGKFVLPVGGKIFDDGLRGLPDVLRLPFPNVVIEYAPEPEKIVNVGKRIIFAFEAEGDVFCHTFVFGQGVWVMLPWVALISRSDKGAALFQTPTHENKTLKIISGTSFIVTAIAGDEYAVACAGDGWKEQGIREMHDDVRCVLEMIEALSCANVGHEPLPVRKQSKQSKKRGALLFDEYRVLVIKNATAQGCVDQCYSVVFDRRSPREHLRRGHIRVINDKKIWVNACVVNAGAGGKIKKAYSIPLKDAA